jgi:hypothetical protein
VWTKGKKINKHGWSILAMVAMLAMRSPMAAMLCDAVETLDAQHKSLDTPPNFYVDASAYFRCSACP